MSAFVRQSIIEKMDHKDKLDRLEGRIEKLESR